MAVILLDGSTVRNFVMDEEAFQKVVDLQFSQLDVDRDGMLSRAELLAEFDRLNIFKEEFESQLQPSPEAMDAIFNLVFETFDSDHSGGVDLVEFREQMKLIMLAIADGIGCIPVSMAVEEGSLLMDAMQYEHAEQANN
ncbi:hypothetical protein O6H91_04G073700 [Diphasiastrum complanatum]|uniref:Uncharacterized protein n=1 Tax=Diphasiastrum complanatum TaxID=34168 RepID=A0ACC2DYF9_DIPCM|nr:hypothetical protein O6H91_04G073700 [Diphasiastrum complanatum]